MIAHSILAILDDAWKPTGGEQAIAENLVNQLGEAPTVLERAATLAACKRIWQAAHPDRRRGGDRRSPHSRNRNQTAETALWSADAAKRLKLAERTILDDVQTAEKLRLPDIERLLDTSIANHRDALRRFAAAPDDVRDKIFRRLRSSPDKPWDDVLRDLGLGDKPGSDDNTFERLCSAWSAAPARARRRFLAEIGVTNRKLIDSISRNAIVEGAR